MAKKTKVIISCAITGAIHTPTMSPPIPITPDEIAQASIEAAEAGAAIAKAILDYLLKRNSFSIITKCYIR